MSTFTIENGNVKEWEDCDHKDSSFWCISCQETLCTHCSTKYQDDSGEYWCEPCKEEYLTTCDRCEVLTSEANTGLCENCSDEMRG